MCTAELVKLTICEFTDLCILLPQAIVTDLRRGNAGCEGFSHFIDKARGRDAASTDVIALERKGREGGRRGKATWDEARGRRAILC